MHRCQAPPGRASPSGIAAGYRRWASLPGIAAGHRCRASPLGIAAGYRRCASLSGIAEVLWSRHSRRHGRRGPLRRQVQSSLPVPSRNGFQAAEWSVRSRRCRRMALRLSSGTLEQSPADAGRKLVCDFLQARKRARAQVRTCARAHAHARTRWESGEVLTPCRHR